LLLASIVIGILLLLAAAVLFQKGHWPQQARALGIAGSVLFVLSLVNGEAYARRAVVYEAKGDAWRALTDLDRAIELVPQNASASLQRGRLRTEAGDFEGALTDFERVLFLRPNDPEAFFHRGICLARKGLQGEAVADFERVLQLTNRLDLAEPAQRYISQFGSLGGSPRQAEPLP
jgi:tetratricopeptide (TPR) repeat protein